MKLLIRVILIVIVVQSVVSSCNRGRKTSPKKLIIDADTANEVDDLFAIVRALKAPELDVVGLSSAQFHTSPLASDNTVLESQIINEDIARILGKDDLPLPLGTKDPLSSMTTPQKSPAAEFIIEQAHAIDAQDTLHITILGSCTNVASAILMDPSIIPKISVSYIGFWHDPQTNEYDKKEFNSGNDTLAVEVLLNTPKLDFNVMTATTCQHLVFEKERVFSELSSKGSIGKYLMHRWDSYKRWWTQEDPEKAKWIMWDVAIIEALIDPSLATKRSFYTPPENTQRQIGIYTDIDQDLMQEDFWTALADE